VLRCISFGLECHAHGRNKIRFCTYGRDQRSGSSVLCTVNDRIYALYHARLYLTLGKAVCSEDPYTIRGYYRYSDPGVKTHSIKFIGAGNQSGAPSARYTGQRQRKLTS
jgi:hypothetical protein